MLSKILAKNTPKEFIIQLPYRTTRELRDAMKDFRNKHFPERSVKAPLNEFYLQFCPKGYSLEDISPNKNSRSLDVYIRKYGQEEGSLRYNDARSKDKTKGTLAGYVLRYGEELGRQRYLEKNSRLSISESALSKNGFSAKQIESIRKRHSEKSAITLENMISSYGIAEGTERYGKYIEENHSTHWSTRYWMKRGYSKEEADIIISDIQRRDLDYFIKKYGEIDGFIKYETCVKAKTKTSGKSKLEVKVYESVKKLKECKYNHLIRGENRNYLVDIYIPSKNLVLECFGDYWHMNPSIYKDDVYNHHLKMTAGEKRKHDLERIADLEKMGYRVIVLWEQDLNKNGIEKTVHESIE